MDHIKTYDPFLALRQCGLPLELFSDGYHTDGRKSHILFENGRGIFVEEVGPGRLMLKPAEGLHFKPFLYFPERYGESHQALKSFIEELRSLERFPALEVSLSQVKGPSAKVHFHFEQDVVAESTLVLTSKTQGLLAALRRSGNAQQAHLQPGLERVIAELKADYDRDWGKQARAYIAAGQENEAGARSVEDCFVHFTSFEEFSKILQRAFQPGWLEAAPSKRAERVLKALDIIGDEVLNHFYAQDFVAKVRQELKASQMRSNESKPRHSTSSQAIDDQPWLL